MSPVAGSLVLCLLVFVAGPIQGLHVSMDRTPDTTFCARLTCVADVEDDSSHIQSIIGLKIYKLTLSHRRFRLASVSVFDPSPHLELARSNVFNVTGTVSLNHGDLMLLFLDESECLYGSFVCELNLLNVSGQPAVMTEKTTPEAGNLDSILLSRMAARLEAHSADVAKEMGSLKAHSADVAKDMRSLEAKFDNLLSHLLTLEQLRNESYETPQLDMCSKGMPVTLARVKILLWNNVEALCDTRTEGGGWIIFQRRRKGDVNFYRNWDDYKKGFGNIHTDYWLGNDVISNLTSLGYNELRVDLKKDLRPYFAHYSKFNVANETLNYQLTVSGYDGTAGDSLNNHNSQFFSTYDRDNDKNSGNCAAMYSGGWWYHGGCLNSNLNGLFGVHNNSGAAWYHTTGYTSADFTEMKIRQG